MWVGGRSKRTGVLRLLERWLQAWHGMVYGVLLASACKSFGVGSGFG